MVTTAIDVRKTEPIHQRLDESLILRNPRDERDIERCSAFVTATVREISGITAERVLHHFPNFTFNDYFFVEDEGTGEVVSNLCLLSWPCHFGQVELKVAELEIVATHRDYRKRGLVRAQMNAFHDAVVAGNFDLSIIEGIPYYYRQYGYTYATDHATSDGLPSRRVPDLPAHITPVSLRPATLEDIPDLARFYDATMSVLDISTIRTLDMWRYVLANAEHPVYMIVESQSQHIAGYVTVWRQPNGDLRVLEHGIPSADTALALLQILKQATDGEILIRWPQESTLVQVSRSLGGAKLPSDQWLLRINNVQSLLTKFAPLFEDRLAQSAHAGLTGDLILNLFRQAYLLRFSEGRLLEVNAVGFVDASMGADGGDLCIPPDAFVRLIMGYRSLAELTDAWPDIVIRSTRRHLLDTLFPKCRSYFSFPYFYYGQMERIV